MGTRRMYQRTCLTESKKRKPGPNYCSLARGRRANKCSCQVGLETTLLVLSLHLTTEIFSGKVFMEELSSQVDTLKFWCRIRPLLTLSTGLMLLLLSLQLFCPTHLE